MLHAFLTTNRSELIDRCKRKVSGRSLFPDLAKLDHGVPQFLDQLAQTLYLDSTSNPAESLKVSGPPDSLGFAATSEMGVTAAKHGQELLEQGFSVSQVVYDYGDLCQAVTELAAEKHASISVGEFGTMNRCLDNAIAQAVSTHKEAKTPEPGDRSLDRQLALDDKMRSRLNSVVVALDLIKQGAVGFGGATGSVLNANLIALRELLNLSLAEIRLQASRPSGHDRSTLAGADSQSPRATDERRH
jgi:hypothetical protein